MFGRDKTKRFEQLMLPHLDAAFNLARWLTRDANDAEDVVQESYLRALRYFDGFRGSDARAWLLKIVRNACYTWLRQHRAGDLAGEFQEGMLSSLVETETPETVALKNANREMVARAMEGLPAEFRELLVLRELEGMDYKQIAEIAGVPIGTVMSRLSRARHRLRASLVEAHQKGAGA